MRRRQLTRQRLVDVPTEQVRESITDAVEEIQRLPVLSEIVIRNVVLPDAVGVVVAHGLGRRPVTWWHSAVRGAATAGLIADFESTTPAGLPNDLTKTLSLRAQGFGATITVDLVVR